MLNQWLATHDGHHRRAGEALGVDPREITRWKREHHIPERWLTALKDKMATVTPPNSDRVYEENLTAIRKQYPHCPESLLELAARTGGLNRAAIIAGVPPPEAYKYAKGILTVSERQGGRIDDALKKARLAPAESLNRQRVINRERTPVESWPPLLRELLEKHHGVIANASRALGYRTPNWIHRIRKGELPFDETAQNLVRRALAGEVIPMATPQRRAAADVDEPDTGEMGIAIVLAKQSLIESIYDAGEAMGGSWVFRQRINSELWLVICRLDDDKLRIFKSIVKLVADKVVTP